eukprot:3205224-Prymnesium_polylepis.2
MCCHRCEQQCEELVAYQQCAPTRDGSVVGQVAALDRREGAVTRMDRTSGQSAIFLDSAFN